MQDFKAGWKGFKSSNSPLYSETKKVKTFWTKKNLKITKQSNAFKGCASSYNVEIFNYSNPFYNVKILNLQLKIC